MLHPRLQPSSLSSVIFTSFSLLSPTFVSGLLDTGFNISKPEFYFDGLIPLAVTAQLPSGCVKAYTMPINCDINILMSPNIPEKGSTLNECCQQECADALLEFERSVREECGSVDLKYLSLDESWMNEAIDGEAAIVLYWQQCLKDLTTQKLCNVSQADYQLAWDAIESETGNTLAIQAFCDDSCLTQNVLLNAPSVENIADLKRMCSEAELQTFPFIDAMKFAELLDPNSTSVDVPNATQEVVDNGQMQGQGSKMERLRWSLIIGMAVLCLVVAG